VRRLVLLAVLCGCNNIFALDTTVLVDAQPDSPTQLGARCAPIGDVPAFGDDLRQIPVPTCTAYAIANQTATALCNGTLFHGEPDQALTNANLEGDLQYAQHPRLAPDEHVFMQYYDSVQGRYVIGELRRTEARFELMSSFIPTTYNWYAEYSTPSAGPDRRMILVDYNSTTSFYDVVELSDASGTWTETKRYPVKDIATGYTMFQMNLSPDALRLVFKQQAMYEQGEDGQLVYSDSVWYTDRATRDEPFRTAVKLTTVPDGVQWPFMTADCGRLYFSALNRVFYVTQPPRF
jgi:hypothetical protein